ncbi:tetrahydrofolate synthase [Sarracenia purpurea var. burkii]
MRKNNNDFLQWAIEVSEDSRQNEWELFIMVIWSLWNNRNSISFDKKYRRPEEILGMATNLLSKFQEGLQITTVRTGASTRDKWVPPNTGWHKANFDEAWCKDGKAGIGVVIRDEYGLVLASYVEQRACLANAENTEALGACRALEVVHSLGLKKVQLEGDALNIIKAINSLELDMSYIGEIIESTKALAKKVITFSCTHTKRQENAVAHALSRIAIENAGTHMWLNYIDPSIDHLVSAECSFQS